MVDRAGAGTPKRRGRAEGRRRGRGYRGELGGGDGDRTRKAREGGRDLRLLGDF